MRKSGSSGAYGMCVTSRKAELRLRGRSFSLPSVVRPEGSVLLKYVIESMLYVISLPGFFRELGQAYDSSLCAVSELCP